MDKCFDFQAFFDELQATKPPYKCPFKNCDKVYRSFGGIQYHVLHSHNTNGWKLPNKLNKWNRNRLNEDLLENTEENEDAKNNENGEEFDGTFRLFFDGQKVLVKEETEIEFTFNEHEETDKPIVLSKQPSNSIQLKDTVVHPLPKPQYSEYELEKEDEYLYKISQKYINNNDGDGEVLNDSMANGYCEDDKNKNESKYKDSGQLEYCLDEEDLHWMSEINKKREEKLHLTEPLFEKMIDNLEKKSQFISQHNRSNSLVDDSALCSVCFDGTSHPSNNIIFCDMCNLAVHQDCYGVPYVPEGFWLCRPCLLSPSKQVQCCLCPKQGGALKQSTDGRWVHVLCAAWVPEVHFANPVFLEPIEGLESIPPARWKLACILCRQRRVGACIQCHRPNCYASFHVLCAILAHFHLAMMPRSETTTNIRSSLFLSSHLIGNIKKLAYCDVHTHEKKYRDNEKSHKSPKKRFTYKFDEDDDDEEESVLSKAKIEKIVSNRVKKGRIVTAELRRGQGSISYPYISNIQAQELYSNVQKMLGLNLDVEQDTNIERDLKVEEDIKDEVVIETEKEEKKGHNTDEDPPPNSPPDNPQFVVDMDSTIELKETKKITNPSIQTAIKPISSENLYNLIQRYWFLKRLSRQGCSLIRNLPYHMTEASEDQVVVENTSKDVPKKMCETDVIIDVKNDDEDVEKVFMKKRVYKKIKRDLLADECMKDKSEDEDEEYKSDKKAHNVEKKSKKIKSIKTTTNETEAMSEEAEEVKNQQSSNRKKYSSFSSLLKEQQEDSIDKGDILNVSGRPQRKRKLSSVLLDYSYYTTPVKKVKRDSTGKSDGIKGGSETKSDLNNSGSPVKDSSLDKTASSHEEDKDRSPNKSALNESNILTSNTSRSESKTQPKKSSKTPRKSMKEISLDFSDFDEIIDQKSNDYGDSNMGIMRKIKKEMVMVKKLVFMMEKREQIKLQQMQNDSRLVDLLLQPLQGLFTHIIKQLRQLDHYRFFHTAVNIKQVPDYLDIIKHPMDFSLMNAKVSRKEYIEVSDVEADFNTIINNCTLYNCPDTVYYKAAIELKNQSADVFKEAKMIEKQINSYLKNQVKLKLVDKSDTITNIQQCINGHAGEGASDNYDDEHVDDDVTEDNHETSDEANEQQNANKTGRRSLSKTVNKNSELSKITSFFNKESGDGGKVVDQSGRSNAESHEETERLKERLNEDFSRNDDGNTANDANLNNDSVGDLSNVENNGVKFKNGEENIDSTLPDKSFFRNSSQEATLNDHSFSKIQKDNFYDNVNTNKTVFLDFRAALSHKSPAKHIKT